MVLRELRITKRRIFKQEVLFLVPVLSCVMASSSSYAESVTYLKREHDKLNVICRGSSGDDPATMKACDHRTAVMNKLKKRKVCLASEGVYRRCH